MNGAIFSPCRRYRYSVWRGWIGGEGAALWIGLNGSRADETRGDPTVTREVNFTKAWGFSQYLKGNLFGWMATKPADMKRESDPVGPDNDRHILEMADRATKIICCWGTHGNHMDRASAVIKLLSGRPLYCLGTNADGTPKHPLYLRGDSTLRPWEPK